MAKLRHGACSVANIAAPCPLVQLFANHRRLYNCNGGGGGGRTVLVVRASDPGSGDPGSILGRVSVLFP